MTVDPKKTREPKRRIHHFAMLKQRSQKIVMVTAYDYPTGRAVDEGGADAVLVGDSLGMVALGFTDTIRVTMDMMVHHAAAVRRAVKRAYLVVDMPFMSYKVSEEQAVMNAARLVQEGGAEAVKLEGGREIAPIVKKIVDSGIPVMGHIGLIPQSVHKLGGYRVQGRHEESADSLVLDAKALAEAGAFAVVLEAIDPTAATEITAQAGIATIGIGAGRGCDGQVLVISDLTGLNPDPAPKFVKKFGNAFELMASAVREFGHEVRSGEFPKEQHEY